MPEPLSDSELGNLPQDTASYGNMPQHAAPYGTMPQPAAPYRNVPHHAERTERHTLTVKEVARMFEQAGVPRIERSIVNWCQPNRQGIARLDAYFDTNERKYFITLQSVTAAIGEEQAKQTANEKPAAAAPENEVRHDAETSASRPAATEEDIKQQREIELKLRDAEITNRAKDLYIERLEKERDRFNEERQSYVERLIRFSGEVGQLRTELQLESSRRAELPHRVENAVNTEDAGDVIEQS